VTGDFFPKNTKHFIDNTDSKHCVLKTCSGLTLSGKHFIGAEIHKNSNMTFSSTTSQN